MAKFQGFIKCCEVCNKEFRVSPSLSRVRTCSPECGYQIRKVANKVDWVIKVCKTCGKEFSRPPSIAETQECCSYDCKHSNPEYLQALSVRTRGENNPGWKGGVSQKTVSVTGKIYYRMPGEIENATTATRRATKLTSTPTWADLAKIKSIYKACKQISEATGIPHHVDHVVPLQGELVSGLHVETNLRIITATENLSKSNHF